MYISPENIIIHRRKMRGMRNRLKSGKKNAETSNKIQVNNTKANSKLIHNHVTT